MFTEKEFEVFSISGLEARMAAIRQQIQPHFKELDEYFVHQLEPALGTVLPIHIAQHRRRTTHAPESTWSAMGGDHRGYKKYPHFQLGINGAYISMWLSLIDNPQNEKEIANTFLKNSKKITTLGPDFVISLDHTVSKVTFLKEMNLEKALIRFRDVKKGELQIGRVLYKDNPLLQDAQKSRQYMLETYEKLAPLYLLARKTQK